jgi:NAD+ kinase
MNEAAYSLAQKLEEFLAAKGISVWLCSAWEWEQARAKASDTNLILTTGGDGTILRAVQVAVPNFIPITGINLGKLGFMTELSIDEVMDKLPALLAGEGWIDERAILEAELSPGSQDEPAGTFYALNDVVVARGTIARMIYVEAHIDDEPLTTYKADGVIVASATGSTGYSLAAGGPILYPHSKELLLLPILPHLSLTYPIVLPPTTVVKLRVTTVHQATLSIDGHINLPINDGSTIVVKSSHKKVRFLRIHPETSFYSSLARRLRKSNI